MKTAEIETLEFGHIIKGISISTEPIELGIISTSSLSRVQTKSFPIELAFKRTERIPFTLLLSSTTQWCLIQEQISVDEETDSMNLPLSVDLMALYIAGLDKENKEKQNHDLNIGVGIGTSQNTDNRNYKSVIIPVNVEWFIDTPFVDNPGRAIADRSEIIFPSISLPVQLSGIQEENLQITNIGATEITCDFICPEWIKLNPQSLVLESNRAKNTKIQIDPANIKKIGHNSGQITLTNSDAKIDVSVEVRANGPVPQFENNISISIPRNLVDDHIYMLEINNVGSGALQVTLPTNMGELEEQNTYNIVDQAKIPLTIPQDILANSQSDNFSFIVETNSIISSSKHISINLKYVLEQVNEIPVVVEKVNKTDDIDIPITMEESTPERKRHYSTAILAVTFILILLAIGFFWMRNGKDNPIKPIIPNKTQLKPVEPNIESIVVPPQVNRIPEVPRRIIVTPPVSTIPDIPLYNSDSGVLINEAQENATQNDDNSVASEVIRDDSTLEFSAKKALSQVKISIYTLPRAFVYIDGERQKDMTPLENISISSERHKIRLEAYDKTRNITIEDRFEDGEIIDLEAAEGDW